MNRIVVLSLLAIFPGLLPIQAGAQPSPDPNVRQVDGMTVYFAVMPAEIIRGHPAAHAESQMHGGPQGVPGEKHVMVALFDAKSGTRITDARVSARVVGAPADTARRLEPMIIANTTTYGNYLSLPKPGPYIIQVEIVRPGLNKTATTRFTFTPAPGG